MATIRERPTQDGKISYHVRIVMSGFPMVCACFSNREDAELFATWKEDLMKNIRNFQPPIEEMITLDTAIDIKIKDAEENNLDARTIGAVKVLKSQFDCFLDKGIGEITYDDLLGHAKILMKKEVRHGGNATSGGIHKLPSKETVMNRFRILGCVYSILCKRGISLTNHPLAVLNYLRGVE